MNKYSITLLVLLLSGIFSANAQTRSFLRISMGANYMSALNVGPEYINFNPSENNQLPSFRFETFPLLYENYNSNFYLTVGASNNMFGYKRELNMDTTLSRKTTGLVIFLGIGTTINTFEKLPISLLVDYGYLPWSKEKNYYNGFYTYSEVNKSNHHVLNSRIDFRFIDNDKFRLSAYYQADWYFAVNNETADSHKYLTHNIGVSFSFSNGWYNPRYL